jgi:hypothetical protein
MRDEMMALCVIDQGPPLLGLIYYISIRNGYNNESEFTF